jgi:hypothetical protein
MTAGALRRFAKKRCLMSSFMTQALSRKLSWKMTFIQSGCGQRVGSLTGAVVTSLPPQKPLNALLLDWKMGQATAPG